MEGGEWVCLWLEIFQQERDMHLVNKRLSEHLVMVTKYIANYGNII